MISIKYDEFKMLAAYIKRHYGIQLKDEKQTMLTGRLQQVVQGLGFDNFTDYYEYLTKDRTGDAITTLVNKVTTNHTFFMREAGHFDFFDKTVLPYLSQTVKDKDLRIWSAGCSSGEEPYTLAMLIHEFFGETKVQWDSKILATDISNQVLDVAQTGIYESERVEPLPKIWKQKFFQTLDSNRCVVSPRIKQEVIFRRFNLMDAQFPFKRKFHVIFCRNVMIYFDDKTRADLIRKFYEMTEPGGYLFIGHSESINREQTSYKYVRPAVYRKE